MNEIIRERNYYATFSHKKLSRQLNNCELQYVYVTLNQRKKSYIWNSLLHDKSLWIRIDIKKLISSFNYKMKMQISCRANTVICNSYYNCVNFKDYEITHVINLNSDFD